MSVAWLVLAAFALAAARRSAPGRTDASPRGAAVSPGGWWRHAVRVRRTPASALPEAVDTVAAALRAGRSLVDGIAFAAADAPSGLGDELTDVVTWVRRGLPVAAAVERWAAAGRDADVALVAAAIGMAGAAGGDTAGALGGVADTLRERRALAREIRALSAQARLSAVVVAVAPVGFAVVAAVADHDTARFLLATPAGIGCLVAGALLDVAGWRWMDRITRSVR